MCLWATANAKKNVENTTLHVSCFVLSVSGYPAAADIPAVEVSQSGGALAGGQWTEAVSFCVHIQTGQKSMKKQKVSQKDVGSLWSPGALLMNALLSCRRNH